MTIRPLLCSLLLPVTLSALLTAPASAAPRMDEKLKASDMIMKSPTGETIPLSACLGNKPLILLFWASWCATCREEIPRLRKLNAGRFKVVAVNEGESAWKTKRFISTNNIDYQVVLDPDGSVAKTFQLPGVPASVILNKAGRIVYKGIGLPEQLDAYEEK